ncbi:peptide ABC transporter substrate-binding protein [uncultured Brachyspira sp.]|uniref:peptide ABC transporter substrate-binding protein n=1 Tax=uncultured Brachyspira sp. TaxID=221953 RepID=UPI00262B78A8|nr:peptide ABC transporter substrate-binding protein [uncultured Brachyspira sp.]
MQKIISIVLIISLIMMSCSKKSPEAEGIVVSLGGEVATIDPHLNNANIGTVYIRHFFEGLMKKDKEGKIVGGMAENYKMSEDGLTYTFYLRTNAKWSDGIPVTAEDFVYSYRRFVDPRTAAPYATLMAPVKNALKVTAGDVPIEELGIKKIDDYTVEITLENPTAYFLELAEMFLPVRKDIIEKFGDTWVLNPESYIGNGPYKMTERVRDEKITMEINTNYYAKDELVAKNITISMIADRNTALAAVRNGQIHFSNLIPNQEIENLKKEGLTVVNHAYGTVFFEINLTNEAFTDSRVRRALALAIDRNYIVESINKSDQLPAGAFVPPLISDYEGEFRANGGDYISVKNEDYQKNVEEAKKLMAEAGYPDGEGYPVIEVLVANDGNVVMVEAIQQMWKNIGVDAIIIPREWSVISQNFRELSYQMVLSGWTGDYNDPMTMLDLYLSYTPSNPGYNNPEYDKLIESSKHIVNNKDRMKVLHEAEAILMNDMPIIPIHYRSNVLMVSTKLKDYKLDPLGKYRFHYAYLEK